MLARNSGPLRRLSRRRGGQVLDDVTVLADYRDELACLYPWLEVDRFDRRALNRALAGLSIREERAA